MSVHPLTPEDLAAKEAVFVLGRVCMTCLRPFDGTTRFQCTTVIKKKIKDKAERWCARGGHLCNGCRLESSIKEGGRVRCFEHRGG